MLYTISLVRDGIRSLQCCEVVAAFSKEAVLLGRTNASMKMP